MDAQGALRMLKTAAEIDRAWGEREDGFAGVLVVSSARTFSWRWSTFTSTIASLPISSLRWLPLAPVGR